MNLPRPLYLSLFTYLPIYLVSVDCCYTYYSPSSTFYCSFPIFVLCYDSPHEYITVYCIMYACRWGREKKTLPILHVNTIVDHKWHSISTWVQFVYTVNMIMVYIFYLLMQATTTKKEILISIQLCKLSLSLTFTVISIINLGSTSHLLELGSCCRSYNCVNSTYTCHIMPHSFI